MTTKELKILKILLEKILIAKGANDEQLYKDNGMR